MHYEIGGLLGLFDPLDGAETRSAPTQEADWTPAEDAHILEGLDRGDSRADLAEALGRTLEAISDRIGTLHKEGRYVVPERHRARWSPEEDALVRLLSSQGRSFRDIGQQVRRTAGAIRLRLEPPRG